MEIMEKYNLLYRLLSFVINHYDTLLKDPAFEKEVICEYCKRTGSKHCLLSLKQLQNDVKF